MIDENGKYTISNAPLGSVRITVASHSAMPKEWPSRGKAPTTPVDIAMATQEKRDGKNVRIPPRYRDPEQSGLSYTVRAGTQTHDIVLPP